MWSRQHSSGLVELKPSRVITRLSSRATRRVQAIFLFAALGFTTSTFALDGCEVLMCLASPTGWSGIAQCGAPMKQMLKDMALGSPLPSCAVAGGATTRTGSYALAMPANYYNQCPSGFTALPSGAYAIMSSTWIPADDTLTWAQQQTLYSGIGDGAGLTPPTGLSAGAMPPEVCVSGAPIGQVKYPLSGGGLVGDPALGVVVPVYSSVTLLQANPSPRVIGVWIDGVLYNQVHW